ncbi:MAG: acyl-CoA thioesterase/BAAT N-terminal domain-containing protein [Gaiellaceae bacterium]
MARWAVPMVVGVVLAAGVTGCTSGDRVDDASIAVSPAIALMDQPVRVSLAGLGADRLATVTATAKDVVGVTWSSSAEFRASGDGTLSLDQAPVGGSYSGANPMGLFQFMAPDDPRPLGFGAPLSGSYLVRLEVKIDGRTVATATATRRSPQAVGVTTKKLTVPADGVYGVLNRPKDTTARKPALLVFGGSEGGLSYPVQEKSALLAAHGYPTLALAYFDAPGLPKDLAAIPLEYFRKALTILRAQPGVDTDHLLVTGASWGGEGSLLVAATYPDLVNGVIAEVPNSYVDVAPFTKKRSSWTVNGRELPFAPAGQFGAPAAEVDPKTYIPVDRIRGPILLACGELDLEWPSCRNVDDITNRIRGRQGVKVLRYRDAGHYIGVFPPYASTTDAALTRTGGSLAGIEAANLDLHTKVLALLASL